MSAGRAKGWLWSGFAAMVAAMAASYAFFADTPADQPEFVTERIERGALTIAVAATGTINAVGLVQVGSQVSGQIRELHVDFNTEVRRGQLIAQIAPEMFAARVREMRADLEVARASVAAVRAQFERAQGEAAAGRSALVNLRAQTRAAEVDVDLARRELARRADPGRGDFVAPIERERAQAAFDRAQATLAGTRAQEQAQASTIEAAEAAARAAEAQHGVSLAAVEQKAAQLEQAELDLERTAIRSPVDGVVIDRSVDVGQTVAASLQAPTLFTLARSLADLQVETYIDEADIGRIQPGQSASFTVASFPGEEFIGTVGQIRKAPQIIQNVVTYVVVIATRNDELKLLPGMTANMRILIDERRDVLRVPNAALRFRPPPGALAEPARGAAANPAPAAGGSARMGEVHVSDGRDRLRPVSVRLGASDGIHTEILDGPLAAGQAVVVGANQPVQAPAARSILNFRL